MQEPSPKGSVTEYLLQAVPLATAAESQNAMQCHGELTLQLSL